MKRTILTILLISSVFYCSAQVSLNAINLENGKYAVGFKHYLTVDSSRTYKRLFDWNDDNIPRPLPVSIWYPIISPPDPKVSLTVLDYMEILKEEVEWEHLPNDQLLNWFDYENTEQNQRHLEEKTSAFANAEPLALTCPLIVYAPSYEASSIENFILCEFLASHGYIVISSPSRGTETRFMEGGTEKDMETQARDLEFIIAEGCRMNHVDRDKIGTVGFSFGGLSNVLAQNRNRLIKTIVSLDGSIKYKYATIKKSPFAAIEKVDVPFIHMAQKIIPKEVIAEDQLDSSLNTSFDFYDDLIYSRAYSLQFNNLTHSHFSSLGVLFEKRDKRQDKSDSEIMESYKWLSVYSLHFLNAFLKNDGQSLAFIENSPEDNETPDGLVTKRQKMPLQKEFSLEGFNKLAKAENYRNLEELYHHVREEHPDLNLDEGKLNNLGLQLTFDPKTTEYGIAILALATKIYPESANLFDSLAEAYLFAGNKEKAVANFKKSLALFPENENAQKRLKLLGKTTK